MIVVRFELHSAITGRVTELARMTIVNTGRGTAQSGDYIVSTLKGRSKEQLDRGQTQRIAEVRAWPRQRLHVWNLVAEALAAMKYGRGA